MSKRPVVCSFLLTPQIELHDTVPALPEVDPTASAMVGGGSILD